MSEFPKPSGPYAVGFVDFEVECEGLCVLVRLYYPNKNNNDELSSWLPSSSYFPSYGYYLRLPMMLYTPIARFVMGGVKQWAVEDGEPIDEVFQKTVIFSHGLAGIRTTYTVICTELASQGYAVAAIEHRDGSASMTLLNSAGNNEKVIPYKYIDTELEDELRIRKEQLQLRCREVEATIKCLESINTATKVTNLWTHGKIEPKSLDFLQSKFNLKELFLMGHSFGAATMLKYASESTRNCSVIALDPWMYALPQVPEAPLRGRFDLMIIDMEQFQWPENLAKIESLLKAWAKKSEMYTIINGSHQQCADVPLLKFGSYMIKKGSPPTVDVLRAINQMSLMFMLEKQLSPDIVSKFGDLIRKF